MNAMKFGYAELSEESDPFQEIHTPKKVAVQQKCLLRKSTYSE